LSWSDFVRPNALEWFDRQMAALEDFRVTLTFCFTPDEAGVEPHYTSPPRQIHGFAEFCAQMVRRYAPGTPRRLPVLLNGKARAGLTVAT
jgi:beta-xylosidase